MIRPDYFIVGYRVYTVADGDISRAAQLFLKNGLNVSFVKNTFTVSTPNIRRVEAVLNGNVDFSRSELRGITGFFCKCRKRYGVMAALVLSAVLFILSSDRVWDIRVSGCTAGKEESILTELSACGFSVGSKWSDTDMSEVEVSLLARSDNVSWVNINRRGTVAYVTVIDKTVNDVPEEKSGYANIVASCDAVIEEITVLKGVAAVKAGDSVKKGDLLISGVLPGESGGGFCYADGIIIGRISDTVTVRVENKREEKIQKNKKLSRVSIKFFDFYANIFNSFNKTPADCDIIETDDKIKIFGVNIPLTVFKAYRVPYETVEIALGEREMTENASREMARALEERLTEATLVRISTCGGFSEDGAYTMTSRIVCLEGIGAELRFIAP